MVQGELAVGTFFAAVLALIVIPQENVPSRETRWGILSDVLVKGNDGGKRNSDTTGGYLDIVAAMSGARRGYCERSEGNICWNKGEERSDELKVLQERSNDNLKVFFLKR